MSIRVYLLLFLASAALPAIAQSVDMPSADHVPPAPPQNVMPPMSAAQMVPTMQMDDQATFAMFKIDEFEREFGSVDATVWNVEAWYGGDFDKLWLRSEGERETGITDARIEAFWDHTFASHWDWQLGLRCDFGSAADFEMSARNWAAFGVQGLAPYWFDVEATAYVGEQGRTAARLRVEYDLLLTQRLILTPEIEFNFYAKNDRARELSSGLSDAEAGLRLRYEIRREFAPYIGVVRKYHRDDTPNALFPAESARNEAQFVVGLRIWL